MIKSELCERVLKLTLSVPPVNVLDTATLNELTAAVRSVGEEVSAILLAGEGKCFSAGASVAEHAPEPVAGMLTALADACYSLQAAPVPVVALAHGACLGGALELAAFCDYIIADPEAKFGVPEIQLAFFPPLACAKLHQLCGRAGAASLIFTGTSVSAERALAMGLVSQLKPQAEWNDIALQFNSFSRPVLRLAKQALNQAAAISRETADKLNALFLSELYKTEDVKEGLASFLEKRKPDWKHR